MYVPKNVRTQKFGKERRILLANLVQVLQKIFPKYKRLSDKKSIQVVLYRLMFCKCCIGYIVEKPAPSM